MIELKHDRLSFSFPDVHPHAKRETPLPENEGCDPTRVVKIGKRTGDQVREGTF